MGCIEILSYVSDSFWEKIEGSYFAAFSNDSHMRFRAIQKQVSDFYGKYF